MIPPPIVINKFGIAINEDNPLELLINFAYHDNKTNIVETKMTIITHRMILKDLALYILKILKDTEELSS